MPGNKEGRAMEVLLGVVVLVAGLILVVLWVLLPFMVSGIHNRVIALDKQQKEVVQLLTGALHEMQKSNSQMETFLSRLET